MIKKIAVLSSVTLVILLAGIYLFVPSGDEVQDEIDQEWTQNGYETIIDDFRRKNKFPDWQKWKYESDLNLAGISFHYDTATQLYYLKTDDYNDLGISGKSYIDSIRMPDKALPEGTVKPRGKAEYIIYQKTRDKIPLTCEPLDKKECTAFMGNKLQENSTKAKKLEKVVEATLDKVFDSDISVEFNYRSFSF